MLNRLALFALVALLLVGCAAAANPVQINAFQNGNIIKLTYFDNFTCYPAPAAVYMNSTESINAASVTACEYGSALGVNTTGSIPRWGMIPAFAGLSVYGYNAFNSTAQGYPTYNGNAILAICGAGQTSTVCIHRPTYIYSPVISALEHGMNVFDGLYGLPEGVLPNAARDLLVSPKKNGTISSSYEVRVWVFDPNIFPNSTTGKCTQIAPSSLNDPTAHCLTNVAALQAAINTNDTAIPAINANNILWKTSGRPISQAVILVAVPLSEGAAEPQFVIRESKDINISNTNLFTYSFIGNSVNQTVPTTTMAQVQQPDLSSVMVPAALIIIAVIIAWYLARGRLWGTKRNKQQAKQRKAQSAMEYLMTYGWAVLILAVVVAALYQLGVFTNISLGSNGCVASPGYLCSNPILSQNDNLTFTLGWFANTKNIYNVAAACSSSATGTGLPNPSPLSGGPQAAMVYLSATGAATNVVANAVAASGALSLSPGQKITVTGLTCYGTNVRPSITPLIGTGFTGFLWLDYTASSGAPTVAGGANPLYTAKIATMSVKVLK